MSFQLSPEVDSNKIFLVKWSELEGRLDPYFYKPFFRSNEQRIKKLKHKKLRSIVTFSCESWDQKNIFPNTFPYIEIGEIDLLTGEILKMSNVQTKKAPSRAKMIIRNEDILVSTTRPSRGAISHYKNNDLCIASTGFSVIRETIINKRFLFYWLRQSSSLWQMEQRSSGGNYPAITQEELGNIKIPIPPKEVQAQIIEKMDTAYAAKKQKEEEAQKLLNSIDDYLLGELGIRLPEQKENTIENRIFYRQLSEISGGLFDPYLNSLNNRDKSETYKFFILKELAYVRKGNTITNDNVIDGNIPVIAGGQTSPYNHNIANNEGNIITVSASGAYSGYVWYHEYPVFASDCTMISSLNTKKLLNRFLFEYLKSEQKNIYNLQHGSGQPHVYPSDLVNNKNSPSPDRKTN